MLSLEKANLLLVDDRPENLLALENILEDLDCHVLKATSGQKALRLILKYDFALILLDVQMPGMNGFEVAELIRCKRKTQQIPIIFVTAISKEARCVFKGYETGAVDYLFKPLDPNILKSKATVFIELYRQKKLLENQTEELKQKAKVLEDEISRRKLMEEELKQHRNHLEALVTERAAELKMTNEQLRCEIIEHKRTEEVLRKTMKGTIQAMALAAEIRDPYTAGHQRKVSQLACAIAREMGLSGEQIEGIRLAGLVHDLGKISVPAEILSKPGELSKIEFGLIENHPQIGHDILKTVEFPWPITNIVFQHQERIDGSGYPQGLSGEDILLEAKIVAVADVVEAMSSHRPYRPALGIAKAIEEISQSKGVLYDFEVVDVCVKLLTEKGFTFV